MGQANSRVLGQAKLRLFEHLMPSLTEASAETLEILMDVEQVSQVLGSLEDLRLKRTVSFCEAFADV